MLDLDSPQWRELWHMYSDTQGGSDVPTMIQRIERAQNDEEFGQALDDMWEAIYHQGDFCPASYVVTPHLARLCQTSPLRWRSHLCICIAYIEAARRSQVRRALLDFQVAEDLVAEYHATLERLPILIGRWIGEEWDRIICIHLTAALLIAKGQVHLGLELVRSAAANRQVECPNCGGFVPLPPPSDEM